MRRMNVTPLLPWSVHPSIHWRAKGAQKMNRAKATKERILECVRNKGKPAAAAVARANFARGREGRETETAATPTAANLGSFTGVLHAAEAREIVWIYADGGRGAAHGKRARCRHCLPLPLLTSPGSSKPSPNPRNPFTTHINT